MAGLAIGYDTGEIEPKIAPLVQAVREAGFVTFSSCEGHVDDEANGRPFPRFGSVAFFATEDDARRVHRALLRYRDGLRCSWVLRAGFVHRREVPGEWALGWTLENGGIIEPVDDDEFAARTVEASWNGDIPALVRMFNEIRAAGTADCKRSGNDADR